MVVDLTEFELQKDMEEKQEIAKATHKVYVEAVMRYANYRLMREVNRC